MKQSLRLLVHNRTDGREWFVQEGSYRDPRPRTLHVLSLEAVR